MNTTEAPLAIAATLSSASTPTPTTLPVYLVRHGLSPEAIIGTMCAVMGVVIPLGIVSVKYAIKRYRGSSVSLVDQ
jgi:hypothetical protein